MLDPNEVRYLDNQLANERIRLPNRTPHNITPKPSSIPPLQPGIRHHLRTSMHGVFAKGWTWHHLGCNLLQISFPFRLVRHTRGIRRCFSSS